MTECLHKTRPCLWFEKDGLAAARLYVSLLPDSRMVSETEGSDPLVMNSILAGAPYQILNGGQRFRLSEAVSIPVSTDDQAETDRLWSALIADGGEESRCGWLKDRWGLSWQFVPRRLGELLSHPDRAGAARAQDAMLQMNKIDIAALERAFEGA